MLRIGMLTSGGDCQALNAAMRGVVKGICNKRKDVEIYGFKDGYKGLIYSDFNMLTSRDFSGILTQGGTILGTSRQPFKLMRVPDKDGIDKVEAMKHTYHKLHLDCLVVLGGNGTHKTANLLREEGLNVVTLPKTIDLAEKNPEKTPWKKTFEMYGYRGTVSALRALVEYIGIEHGVIEKVVEIPTMAWGVPGEYPYYLSNTNLDNDNLDLFNEEVHLMTYHNILSPGAIGGYGDSFPYFHVTKYGLKCIEERDIFPYDPDAYMQKISSISSIDEWEKFYIEQSLKCYNADAFESALIMIGLAGEYLATQLIEKMESFLANKEPTLQATYVNALQGKNVVS